MHENKDYTGAITYYKKAIAINPKMPEPYINIVQIYRLQNDTARANAAIEHGLSNLPDNKELLSMKNDIQTEEAGNLYNSAAKYFNAGDYKTALDNYLKIKLQTPEVLLLHSFLLLLSSGKMKKLLNTLKKYFKKPE